MKNLKYTLAIVVFFLALLGIAHGTEDLNFSHNQVWKPVDSVWGPECAYGGKEPQCRLVEMKRNGASAEAIRFTEKWHKHTGNIACLSAFREFGKVDLAEVTRPTYNDPMVSDFYLVNGPSGIIDLYDRIRGLDLSTGAGYSKIKAKYSNVDLWPMQTFVSMKLLRSSAQRFVFRFLLLNGCRACDVAGSAVYAFDFDPTGRFIKASLIGLNEQF